MWPLQYWSIERCSSLWCMCMFIGENGSLASGPMASMGICCKAVQVDGILPWLLRLFVWPTVHNLYHCNGSLFHLSSRYAEWVNRWILWFSLSVCFWVNKFGKIPAMGMYQFVLFGDGIINLFCRISHTFDGATGIGVSSSGPLSLCPNCMMR